MADLAPARRASEPAHLADGEGREAVLQVEALGADAAGHALVLLLGLLVAERHRRERLRLAAREECRAVRARQHGRLHHQLAHRGRAAPVGARAAARDHLTERLGRVRLEGQLHVRQLERVARGPRGRLEARVGWLARRRLVVVTRVGRLAGGGRGGGELALDLDLERVERRVALLLGPHRQRLLERARAHALDLVRDLFRDLPDVLGRLRLAHDGLPRGERGADVADGLVAERAGRHDLRLRHELAEPLDHQDGARGAGDHDRDIRARLRVHRRVQHPLAVGAARDAHAGDGLLEGHVRDHQRRRRAAHCHAVGRRLRVVREEVGANLRLLRPAFRERGADRPVDEPSGEDLVVAGPLTLDVPARRLARRAVPLRKVDAQRHKVGRRAARLEARARKHDAVFVRDEDSAAGESGNPTSLKSSLPALGDQAQLVHVLLRAPHAKVAVGRQLARLGRGERDRAPRVGGSADQRASRAEGKGARCARDGLRAQARIEHGREQGRREPHPGLQLSSAHACRLHVANFEIEKVQKLGLEGSDRREMSTKVAATRLRKEYNAILQVTRADCTLYSAP